VLAAEDFNGLETATPAGLARPSAQFQEKMAESLERLANAIRSGELSARGLNIKSDVKFDDWMKHDIVISVEMPLNDWTGPIVKATQVYKTG
jgi:hypothetical protein